MSDLPDPIIGIDLGTSNTVVAVCDDAGARVLPDDRGARIHPSVVSFQPNGSVVVGAEAKQRKVIDPRNTVYSVKRVIGRGFRSREVGTMAGRVPYALKEGANEQPVVATRAGEFAIPELSAIVLDHVRGIAQRALREEVTRAVITVPANFGEAQRAATATAGAIAGLTVVRVLNEPTAAALAYGHSRELSRVIAVYDFGGGTFDVTILKLEDQVYEVLGTAGDAFLGGDDIDERLVDHMVARFLAEHRIDLRANETATVRLRAVAEQTKIELSRRTRAIVKVDEIAYGAGGKPLDLQIEITRDELVGRVGDIVDRTFRVCEEAITLAGLPIAAIGDVVLVGGTTLIPHVRERVAGFFGRAPRSDIHPEEAVALGASLQAAALQRILSEKRTTATQAVVPPPTLPPPVVAATPSGRPAPAPTQRPATRGETIDVFNGGGAAPGAPAGPPADGARAIGRITRPHGMPAIKERDTTRGTGPAPAIAAAAPPPTPPARTQYGVAPAPRPAAAPPPVPPKAFEDETTAARPERLPGVRAGTVDPVATGRARTGSTPLDSALDEPAGSRPLDGPSPVVLDRPSPVVLDVTPRGLGIATVAGYCEELIRRNARLPAESKRLFTTSRDKQQSVRIRICQGESRRLDHNVVIGDLVLDSLEPRPRGETTIEVVFAVDASGVLQVRARDALTGREQRASLALLGAQSQEEVAASAERVRALRR